MWVVKADCQIISAIIHTVADYYQDYILQFAVLVVHTLWRMVAHLMVSSSPLRCLNLLWRIRICSKETCNMKSMSVKSSHKHSTPQKIDTILDSVAIVNPGMLNNKIHNQQKVLLGNVRMCSLGKCDD